VIVEASQVRAGHVAMALQGWSQVHASYALANGAWVVEYESGALRYYHQLEPVRLRLDPAMPDDF
jgi:hypothetical protein